MTNADESEGDNAWFCSRCCEYNQKCTCGDESYRSDCASYLMREDITDRERERYMLNYIHAHGDEALELVLEDMVEAYRVCGLIEVR